ncbi:DUF3667 domain-containing protein [Flavobacterium sp.]|uniref:DUF3667 domain-containing protein n=1 Tax=Flavobacterium sp. TaxID=239 RepID=UPI003D122CA3
MNCTSCNPELSTNFCPDCGQPKNIKRINGQYILHEIEHVLHFERGILYTIRELITNPGHNIRKYLNENRSRLVKPILFIIITSLIYSVLTHFFHIEEKYVRLEGAEKTSLFKIFQWIEAHYGYANIIMGIFISMWLKLFFNKFGYNLFELLILLCFVMGIAMLIFSLFAVLQGMLGVKLVNIGGILGIVYCAWSIGHFYGKDKISNYIKALLAYLLGMLTFSILAFFLGLAIDTLVKH